MFLRFLDDEAYLRSVAQGCPGRSKVTYLNPWVKRHSIGAFKVFFRSEDDLVRLTCLELRVFIPSFLRVARGKEVQTTTVCIGHPAVVEQAN